LATGAKSSSPTSKYVKGSNYMEIDSKIYQILDGERANQKALMHINKRE
jgi:hypothetical protein